MIRLELKWLVGGCAISAVFIYTDHDETQAKKSHKVTKPSWMVRKLGTRVI